MLILGAAQSVHHPSTKAGSMKRGNSRLPPNTPDASMNSGVSWQVQGVRHQARDAALEAARRPEELAGLDQLDTQFHSSGRGGQDAPGQAASPYADGLVTDAIARLERRLDQ